MHKVLLHLIHYNIVIVLHYTISTNYILTFINIIIPIGVFIYIIFASSNKH